MPNSSKPSFARYIGIDYSGAETPTSSLKGLRGLNGKNVPVTGGASDIGQAMAIDHGPDGIRVNCLCPGDVQTPMLPDDAAKRGMSWEAYAAEAADRPLGRIGTAEEIAEAVLYLASDDSSFVTGTALVVDGGGIAG